MENIIISFEPLFCRIEKFILWQNRYSSLCAFIFLNGIFYAIAHAGLRPYCAITIVLFLFHILDFIKKKGFVDDEKHLSQLTELALHSYRHVYQTQEKLNIIKVENRTKYSLIIIVLCLLCAYVGIKISGYYVSYLIMLTLFTLPAVVYHKLLQRLLRRVAPILEQLDQSMDYQRRTLIDRKDLLVKIKTPGLNENDDDDEDITNIKQQSNSSKGQVVIVTDQVDDDDDDSEKNLVSMDSEIEMLRLKSKERNFDMLTDSTSSIIDDDLSGTTEFYTTIVNNIDGRQRIKIKGDEIKIKGQTTNKQRSNIIDKNMFQFKNANVENMNIEADLTSFDFLDEYDDNS